VDKRKIHHHGTSNRLTKLEEDNCNTDIYCDPDTRWWMWKSEGWEEIKRKKLERQRDKALYIL
jgi:hypothetical protein